MVRCQRGDAAVRAAAAAHARYAASGSPAGAPWAAASGSSAGEPSATASGSPASSPSARALRAARALGLATLGLGTLALGTLGSARAQDAAPATAAPAAPAAAGTVEVVLRTGRVVTAAQWRGDPASGFTGRVGDDDERFAGADVLLVRGVAAAIPNLPSAWLRGGDVVRGAVVDGDAGGNRVDLQSPVLGRIALAIDRLDALAAPATADPLRLRLPNGVDEALFVRAKVGLDVLAGSLHQCGEPGIRFETTGSPPRWFRVEDVAALRLGGAVARADQPEATLWTRVGDRLGVRAVRFDQDGVQCELEGGVAATVRLQDVGALAFGSAVAWLSDLEPTAVRESGFDGDVVHPFQRDRSAVGGPLVCGGRAVGKGLGVHSKSRLTFTAPPRATAFWTRVGFDDSATALGLEPRVALRVLVADKVVFERKDFALGQPAQDCGVVPVQPGALVVLEVDHGAGRDLGDRIDWLAPLFLLQQP